MVEMHEYCENTINTCKECKNIHNLHKDEEGQIEDYHLIVPNKNNNKTKKRTARDADLNDFRNKNVKLKTKPGFHASQLDAFYAIDSESDNSLSASKSASDSSKSNSRKSNKSASSKNSSSKKKRTARDADLNDFRNKNVKLKAKPGFHASQLDAFYAIDSESDNSRSKDSHKGGNNKNKKNKSKKNNNKNSKKTMKN